MHCFLFQKFILNSTSLSKFRNISGDSCCVDTKFAQDSSFSPRTRQVHWLVLSSVCLTNDLFSLCTGMGHQDDRLQVRGIKPGTATLTCLGIITVKCLSISSRIQKRQKEEDSSLSISYLNTSKIVWQLM